MLKSNWIRGGILGLLGLGLPVLTIAATPSKSKLALINGKPSQTSAKTAVTAKPMTAKTAVAGKSSKNAKTGLSTKSVGALHKHTTLSKKPLAKGHTALKSRAASHKTLTSASKKNVKPLVKSHATAKAMTHTKTSAKALMSVKKPVGSSKTSAKPMATTKKPAAKTLSTKAAHHKPSTLIHKPAVTN